VLRFNLHIMNELHQMNGIKYATAEATVNYVSILQGVDEICTKVLRILISVFVKQQWNIRIGRQRLPTA